MTDSKLAIAQIDARLWRERAQRLEARWKTLAGAAEAMLAWSESGGPVCDQLAAALALPEAEPIEEGEPSVHQNAS